MKEKSKMKNLLRQETTHIFMILLFTFAASQSLAAESTVDEEFAPNNELFVGEKIFEEGYLESANENYRLTLNKDGNLVLQSWPKEKNIWASHTSGAGGEYLVLEDDGNLVMYTKKDKTVWESDTSGSGADKLMLHNTGELALYFGSEKVWSTEDVVDENDATNNKLYIDQKLDRNDYLESANRNYRLTLDKNGDLVLSNLLEDEELWSSDTGGNDSEYLVFEDDGNLVLYTKSEEVVWQSNTKDTGADKLMLHNNGNLVLYNDDSAVWSTTLNMSKPTYESQEPIVVNFANLPGNKKDWIGLYKEDASGKKYEQYKYTGGDESGTIEFNGLPAGKFEARLFYDNSYDPELKISFTVNALSLVKTTYLANEKIVVNYVDLAGHKKDWIGIFEKGASNKKYEQYFYTYGAKSGTMFFDALPAGEYEARLFFDNSYELESKVSFTVNALSIPKEDYEVNETIVLYYFNLPEKKENWIGIYKKDASNKKFEQYSYTDGASGTLEFDALPAGQYEARLFYGKSDKEFVCKVSFTINALSMISTTFLANETIAVNYAGLLGDKKDWIGVFEKGASNKDYKQFFYTDGAVSGTMQFDALPAGEYEFRLFYENSYDLVCKLSFTVNSLSMSKNYYLEKEPIVVNYVGLPKKKKNWIGIYNMDKGDSYKEYEQYKYTGGSTSGTMQFDGLPAGEYKARLFYDNSYDLVCEIPFTVSKE